MRDRCLVAILVLVSLAKSQPVTAQNACSYYCISFAGTFSVQDVIEYTRMNSLEIPIGVDPIPPAPFWWDSSWIANHLEPAGDAWEMLTDLTLDYTAGTGKIRIVLATNPDYWPPECFDAMACAEEAFPIGGYSASKTIWINLVDYGDADWFEEGGTVQGNQFDLTSILVHEIAHVLGFGHTEEGAEVCGVMTPSISRGEVQRFIGPLDREATECYYAPLPVSDIQSFTAQGSGHDVNLEFKVQNGPNQEYGAVYVSGSSAGPARLIDVLTDLAAVLPDSNTWVDSYRLPPGGSYVYWLDIGGSPTSFAAFRTPDGLYPSSTYGTVTGSARPTVDPPEITFAADEPIDFGGAISLIWNPSTDNDLVDYYNLYRKSSPPGQPGQGVWKYVTSFYWPGPDYYLDEEALTNWTTQYRISAAHHGEYTLQPGHGNEGIWNDSSEPVTTMAVHNFWNDQVTLLSNDTLVVCPAGDDESVMADIVIWGSNISPSVGIPPIMLELYVESESSQTCDFQPLHPDGPTDDAGRTWFTASAVGGAGETDLVFKLFNSTYVFDQLTVYLKSPDENGDGTVNVADFALFGQSYTSPPKPYVWYRDYVAPFGAINLSDFAHFGSHYGHHCGGGQLTATRYAQSDANIQIALTEVLSATDSRALHADVSVSDLSAFKAMLVHLRSDNPMLEFVGWEKGSFPGRVLVTPVVRDGVKEIAIGVLDGEEFVAGTASLGRLVFGIESKDDLALTTRDFETRAADILSTTDTVLRLEGADTGDTWQVPRIVTDELAQNRPNPFNPTTTVSYSISKPGYVSLRVFGVDGSLVRTLVDRDQKPNRYDVVWDGTDDEGRRVASGVYFYSLRTPLFIATKKMVLLK